MNKYIFITLPLIVFVTLGNDSISLSLYFPPVKYRGEKQGGMKS